MQNVWKCKCGEFKVCIGKLQRSHTAMRILERLGIQTSSSFVKISVRIPNFKANFSLF